MSELQRYKVVMFPHHDPRYEECVIVKADADETESDVFTIEALEQEFEALRRLDPLAKEGVFEIAEDLSDRAAAIMDEPRAKKLHREIDRLTSEWCDLFGIEPFDEDEWAKGYQQRLKDDDNLKKRWMN